MGIIGYYWVTDNSLLIADTPGSNLMNGNIRQNEEISNAFEYRRVSKLFIVVKSNVRKEEVMSKIKEFTNRLVNVPLGVLGVIVTTMDFEREWTEQEFTADCDETLEISDIVYSSKNKSGKDLLADIHKVCGEPKSLTFKIKHSNPNVLQKVVNKNMTKRTPGNCLYCLMICRINRGDLIESSVA